MKSAINFELRLSEPLGEVVNSKNRRQFRLRVNPNAKKLYVKKRYAHCVSWRLNNFY